MREKVESERRMRTLEDVIDISRTRQEEKWNDGSYCIYLMRIERHTSFRRSSCSAEHFQEAIDSFQIQSTPPPPTPRSPVAPEYFISRCQPQLGWLTGRGTLVWRVFPDGNGHRKWKSNRAILQNLIYGARLIAGHTHTHTHTQNHIHTKIKKKQNRGP